MKYDFTDQKHREAVLEFTDRLFYIGITGHRLGTFHSPRVFSWFKLNNTERKMIYAIAKDW